MSWRPQALGRNEPTGAVCLSSHWAAAAIAIGIALADVVSPEISGRCPGPCGVLPFRLAQQAIGPAGLARQPARILPGVVPRDVDHGAAALAPAFVAWSGLVRAAARGDAGAPLLER